MLSGKEALQGWCRGRKVKGAIGQRRSCMDSVGERKVKCAIWQSRPRVDSGGGRQVKGAIEQRRPCIDVVEGRGKMCYLAKKISHG